jgi:hypothetical protein
MPDREQRIREIAYQLWVLEGRPDGRADSHWFEAAALHQAEVTGGAGAERESASHANPAAANETIGTRTSDPTGDSAKPGRKRGRSIRARGSDDGNARAGDQP